MRSNEFDLNRRSVNQCPCGKSNLDGKFAPFKGYRNKGHCFSCGETFFPDSAGGKPINEKKEIGKIVIPPSFIPQEVLKQSLGRYDENVLMVYLSKLTNIETAVKIWNTYFIGTAMYWRGSTVFWQIDIEGRIRNGKIIQYAMRPDEKCFLGINCGRVKTNMPLVKWVSKLTGQQNFNLKQCFFGECLLAVFPDRKVCILESEKSALIAAAYHQNFVWLACGGADGLSDEKIKVLEGRDVTLFPDLGKFELWSEKASRMKKKLTKAKIKISDVLERAATDEERRSGLDLADFLMKLDWSKYEK